MTRTFVELPLFRSRWEDLGLTDQDLIRLQEELLADPKVGDVRAVSARCVLRLNIAARAAG